MTPRSCSSTRHRRFTSLPSLALAACLGLLPLLPACGGQSDAVSTDTGNPPVIIGQKLHVTPSDSGVVVAGDAGAVTPGASVAVENVTRGRSRVTTAAQDGSFEVELEGTAQDEYRVDATLGGRTTSAPLNTSGGGQTGLAGLEFLLDDSMGFTPLQGTTVRLSFEETQFGISAGCNNLGGTYSQCAGKLCASDLFTTDIACDSPRQMQDEWLADFFTSQPSLSLSGDRLTLTGTDATLEFVDSEVAEPDRPLIGPTWTIDTLIDGETVSIVPVTATVQFRTDGEMRLNDGCNNVTGTFASSGSTLTLSDITTTDRGCEGINFAVAQHIGEVLTGGTLQFEIDAARLSLQRGDKGLLATSPCVSSLLDYECPE